MKHILSALVQNKPGVLAHVAGMFAARAFNIDSLVVGRTEDPQLSRMTIVVIGDDRVVEQVRKQLAKIVSVVKVQDFTGQPIVARDLLLLSVAAPPEKRPQVLALFEDVDVILAPATPCVAPAIGQQTFMLDGVEMPVRPNIGIYTQPISFIGLPVVAVPVPLKPLPIGVQVIAAPWREDIALRVAQYLEDMGAVVAPRPPLN